MITADTLAEEVLMLRAENKALRDEIIGLRGLLAKAVDRHKRDSAVLESEIHRLNTEVSRLIGKVSQ